MKTFQILFLLLAAACTVSSVHASVLSVEQALDSASIRQSNVPCNNTVTGNSVVYGCDNQVTGSDNFVDGYGNYVSGSGNRVNGSGMSVTGSENLISGSNNAVSGSNNRICGNGLSVSVSNQVVGCN